MRVFRRLPPQANRLSAVMAHANGKVRDSVPEMLPYGDGGWIEGDGNGGSEWGYGDGGNRRRVGGVVDTEQSTDDEDGNDDNDLSVSAGPSSVVGDGQAIDDDGPTTDAQIEEVEEIGEREEEVVASGAESYGTQSSGKLAAGGFSLSASAPLAELRNSSSQYACRTLGTSRVVVVAPAGALPGQEIKLAMASGGWVVVTTRTRHNAVQFSWRTERQVSPK